MIGSHNSDIDLTFYNDKVKEVIDAGIMAEPFTYVPIKAGHMELVGGNAVVFGKITEGYDVKAPNIETEIDYQGVTYYGGAIGAEFITPRINLAVRFLQIGDTIINSFVDPWFDFTEYHKGDLVTRLFPGGVNYYYLCKTTTTGNDPIDLDNWIYWTQLGRVDSMSFKRIVGRAVITIPEIVVEGSSYNITVANVEEGMVSTTFSYTAGPGDLYTTVMGGLIAELAVLGTDYLGSDWISRTISIFPRARYFQQTPVYEAGDVNTVYKDFSISFYVLTLGYTIKFPDLKCGATHGFGIVYKDGAGRTCSVAKTNSMDVYIPFYTEEPTNLLESIISLLFKVYHKPPDWAESYEIVYFGNLTMEFFLQLRADDITLIPDSNGNRFSVNIQETLEWTWNKNNRWKVAAYTWLPGDRMRLMGTIDDVSGIVAKYDTLYDYEIEETGTQYGEAIGVDWLIVQAKKRPNIFVGETNIIIEIYRPRKGLSQSAAYGTGMVFDVAIDVFGNKYHKGDIDQVFDAGGVCTIAAVINNTANDCWKYVRLNYEHETGNILPFWAESMFPSDWWSDQDINRKLTSSGFPFLDDLSQRQVALDERIRHGGYLITGTRTNNIAHFTYDKFEDLPKKNGDITGLREVGFTLKVIQLYKETSIYINRIQTFNPDLTDQFTLIDKFLGTVRPMETDYGCQHPDSIMVNGRDLYYWDNSQGELIRSSPNGQIAISDPQYKMSRWFKELVKWIQISGGKDLLEVRIGANNDHEEIWSTFRMKGEVKGVIFSEKQGRFISRLNQVTENYVHLGNFFAHLYHQRLWIMNIDEGQDYLSWSGMRTYAEVEVVSNIEPLRNKIFNAVALFADHLLQSLAKFVRIPAEASGSNELMESNIPIWDRREGIYFGEILRDENSPGNFVSVIDAKMNGRLLRGRYCFVRFKTEEHDEKVRIDSVVIHSTPSERNV